MRIIALELETLERSPPEPIFLELPDMAMRIGCARSDLIQALDDLRTLALIEGPGAYADGWLFRRITAKGHVYIDEIRDPRRWSEIKQFYEVGQIS